MIRVIFRVLQYNEVTKESRNQHVITKHLTEIGKGFKLYYKGLVYVVDSLLNKNNGDVVAYCKEMKGIDYRFDNQVISLADSIEE